MSHTYPTFEELEEAFYGPDGDRDGDWHAFSVEQSDYGDGWVLVDNDTNEVIFHEPANASYPKLVNHTNCPVGIAAWGPEYGDFVNIAIVCEDCNEVIYDVDAD